MSRIALIGLQHETNTFVPAATTLDRFLQPDAWPGLVEGNNVFDAIAGANLPMAGFISEMSGKYELLPVLWCSAGPGGVVTDDAFEWICARLMSGLARIGSYDALYLDLHGAMVTQSFDDAEGELLQRLRKITQPSLPIVVSLDYHANVSGEMVNLADILVGYRTYPHVDMAETGRRAGRLLQQRLAGKKVVAGFANRLPMTALVWQSTFSDPMLSIMQQAAASEREPNLSVSVFAGFPLADIAEAGASVVVYGSDERKTRATAESLAQMLSNVPAFRSRVFTPQEAVAHALVRRNGNGPVVLADTEDNPGAGGSADTTRLLRELLNSGMSRSAAGVICDPGAAAAAHAAGAGAQIRVALGGKSGVPGDRPIEALFDVAALGSGQFTGAGAFYRGCRFDLGPMACLRYGETSIAVSSRPQQAADRTMFQHVGIDPAAMDVLAVKSSVHFRADFEPLASEILVVAAGGSNPIDLRTLDYRNYMRLQ